MANLNTYPDAEIKDIISMRDAGTSYADMSATWEKRHGVERSDECLKKAYYRYREIHTEVGDSLAGHLKARERQRRANAISSKENKTLISEAIKREDIQDSIRAAAAVLNAKPYVKPKAAKHDKKKSDMTLELLISDVHFGKLTDTFNHEVLKRRIAQIAKTTVAEIRRNQLTYNVERIVLAFIGDIIESATMHGVESQRGCEFGNSRQVQEALTILFRDLVVPIAETGVKVDCVGVTGNHDRTEMNRTFHHPGEENLTWIIYKTMEEFCKIKKLDNVSWSIPRDSYCVQDIYGESVLYEHYDNAGNGDRRALENLMAKRVRQTNQPLHFMRGGHFHEPAEFGIGKIVVNGSVPGNDSYSKVLGFDCEPSQTLNSYIKRDRSDKIKRVSSFYKRMLIQLD